MLLFLLACTTPENTDSAEDTAEDTAEDSAIDSGDSDSGDSGDSDSGDSGDSDTGETATDADSDGSTADVDCDDDDASVHPGATETPYDGVDQDCDGSDLTDVDGDGYANGAADCDDGNPDIHAGADDLPKDGVDSDCDGADNIDGDSDGYDDASLGGDDCDDVDPAVFPGAPDSWNDGIDSNCDGSDNTVAALADAPASILGADSAQDLVGQDVALCDIDGDTLLDLVVSAPFSDSYSGQIGIFYGDGATTWGPDMRLSDADTLITSNALFLGFEVGCTDLDGDGNDDLVTGRGEIDYLDYYVADFELVIWYGDGAKFAATADESTADARFEMTLGVTPDIPSVYGRSFTADDLDGDGAAEIVVINDADADLAEADDTFYVLGGGRYSGTYQLADEAIARIRGEGLSAATRLPDLDGDGVSELFLGENGYTGPDTSSDTSPDTSSDTSSDPVYLGRASLLEGDVQTEGDVGELAYGFWTGSGAVELGFAGAAGDFDGDGLQDVAISTIADDAGAEDGGAEDAGAIYLFAPAEGVVPAAGSSDDATTVVRGTSVTGYLGYTLQNVGDIDGDGADDLLTAEIYGDSTYGRIWLLSGATSVDGAATPDAAALYAWTGEQANALTGNALAAGDLDADGVTDFVVSAYAYMSDGVTSNGKVYLLLSGG